MGVLLHRASFLLAVLGAVFGLIATMAAPSPVEPVWIVALAAVTFLLSHALALALGAAGWMVFPPEHRSVLAELGARAALDT